MKKLSGAETKLVICVIAFAFIFITVGTGNIMYELDMSCVAFVRGLTAFFTGLLGFMTVLIMVGGVRD